MRVRLTLLFAVLVACVGCHGPRHTAALDPPEPAPVARPFLPERTRRAVDGRTLPEVRERLAGVWKFRVTVVGAVQEVSVGYFADRGEQASVTQTGVISVRLPKDSGPGQTWEVEAAFDTDKPIQRENGLVVWRFAKPVATIRVG